MKQGILFIAFFISADIAHAATDYNDLWQKANNLYNNKQYDSAEYYYNKIAEQNPQNENIYYNLGNVHYRLNNIGLAVLNYEKALKINPAFTNASDNLYLTQSRISNRIQAVPKIFFVRWWHSITTSSYTNIYAIISIILFFAVIIYLILLRLGAIQLKLPTRATVTIFILCVLLIFLGLVSAGKRVTDKYAIVTEHESPLMLSPKQGTSQSLIPEGTKVEITGNQKGWYEVTLPDGRTGWMQRYVIEKI